MIEPNGDEDIDENRYEPERQELRLRDDARQRYELKRLIEYLERQQGIGAACNE